MLPPGGWTWYYTNAVFYFTVFLFYFYLLSISSFNGPVAAFTDHFMSGVSFPRTDFTTKNKAKDCVGMSCDDCRTAAVKMNQVFFVRLRVRIHPLTSDLPRENVRQEI